MRCMTARSAAGESMACDEPSVIDQDVQSAEQAAKLVEQCLHPIDVGDIADQNRATSTEGLYLSLHVLRLVDAVVAMHADIGTPLGEGQGNGTPDPTGRAGHEGHFALQVFLH